MSEIVIPSEVTDINDGAFFSCPELRKIAFQKCSQLETIGDDCFRHTDVETITIPSRAKTIGRCAFSECERPKTILAESDTIREDAQIADCSTPVFRKPPWTEDCTVGGEKPGQWTLLSPENTHTSPNTPAGLRNWPDPAGSGEFNEPFDDFFDEPLEGAFEEVAEEPS